ncbi:MAG: amidase [Betaproteobacteria bacterium]|nr:MAG: amidase [Betaproteobacteria bacterium]
MNSLAEYSRYDAVGLADLVRRRLVSPREVFEAAIARIEYLNPILNAVVIPMFDEASRIVETDLPDGPLAGVPLLLKDFGALYKGSVCSLSSSLLQNSVADHDSTIVRLYKKAGMVVVGRSNIPNFAAAVTTESRFRGPVRNPWDLTRMAGGSSGGAAAAVAAGLVPIAHGTDAAGSIRVPASHCGVFGLKTTRGRVSVGPDLGEPAGGLGAHHALTRTVRDSAIALDVIQGYQVGDPYTAPPPQRCYFKETTRDPGTLRIAFSTKAPGGLAVDKECIRAVEDAAKLCTDLGHDLEEGAPDFDFGAMTMHFLLVHGAHWSKSIIDLAAKLNRDPYPDEIEPSVMAWAQYCATKSAIEYAEALKITHRIARQINAFFDDYDVFLCPVATSPALPLGTINTMEPDLMKYVDQMWAHMAFTAQFNCSGQPAMSIPLYWTSNGLPVGTQFVGRFGDEACLFRLAGQLERARPWKHRSPPFDATQIRPVHGSASIRPSSRGASGNGRTT